MTVQGIDNEVFHFEFTRELPVDDYNMGDKEEPQEMGDSARILAMRSQNYVDVMDCFSPMYGEGREGEERRKRWEG